MLVWLHQEPGAVHCICSPGNPFCTSEAVQTLTVLTSFLRGSSLTDQVFPLKFCTTLPIHHEHKLYTRFEAEAEHESHARECISGSYSYSTMPWQALMQINDTGRQDAKVAQKHGTPAMHLSETRCRLQVGLSSN